MVRSRAINTIGAIVTGAVLVIVVVSKFAEGAWIAVAAMVVIWFTMRGIHQHYAKVALELTPDEETALTLPSSNISIVLVSKLHRPTLRALAYARATRPSRLEAITVDVDEAETLRLKEEWDRRNMPLPLTVVSSPYREITRPVIEYVKRLRRESPHDIVTVYVPEYVLGHWWEQVLHNQSALRLKARLLYQRGVVVASVPYQLRSATKALSAVGKLPDPRARGATAAAVPGAGGPNGPAPSPDGHRTADEAPVRWLTAGRDALHAAELRAEMTEISPQTGPGHCTPIAESQDRQVVDVAGMLRAVTLRPHGTSQVMEADLWDGTGNVTLIWLGRREIAGIQPGRRIVVHGRLTCVRGERAIYNPSYELRPAAGERPA
jgi:hypothetical protein